MVDVVSRQANNPAARAEAQRVAQEAIQRAQMNAKEAAEYASHSKLAKRVKEPGFFDKMGSVLNKAGFILMGVSALGWVAKGATALKFVQGTRAAGALAKTGEAVELLNKSGKDLPKAVENLLPGGKVSGWLNKHANAAEKGTVAHYAQKWSDKSPFIKKSVETLKENQWQTTAFSAAMIAQSTGSMFSQWKTNLRTIQQMQYDMTGEKISKWKAAFGGGLNPLVRQAKKDMSGGKALLGTAADVAGIAGNTWVMLRLRDGGTEAGRMGGFGYMIKSAGIAMVPGVASMFLKSNNTALDGYRQLYQGFGTKGQADFDAYYKVVGGLAKGAPDEQVKRVAQLAFQQQMQPKDLLHMMAETNFLKGGFAAKVQKQRDHGKAANHANYAMQA